VGEAVGAVLTSHVHMTSTTKYVFTSVVHLMTGAPLAWLEVTVDYKVVAPIYIIAAARVALFWVTAGLILWVYTKTATIVGLIAAFVYVIECFLWHQAEVKGHVHFPREVLFVICLDPLNYALDTVGSGPRLAARILHTTVLLFRAIAVAIVVAVIRMYPVYVAAWSCYKHAPMKAYDRGTCPKLHLGQGDNMPDWVCTDDAYKYDNGCLLEPENASWSGYPAIVHYLLLALSIDIGAYVLLALVTATRQ
jgi:hypothetical protein